MPETYRPITLLSKVFEKMLLRFVALDLPPTEGQFGFRSQHSTTLQLSRVIHRMSDCANRKLYFVAIFLDMEEAFDRVWHEGLSTSPAPRRLVRIIASFLSDRRVVVTVERITPKIR